MAHPLYWPGKYFFYPVGNTSAVSLTRDLAPEDSANILLLGCGDPRNVLYTILCEPQIASRTLDFTCCDMDPGILARNVLLLSMIADTQLYTSAIWNIYFHMYLDKNSHSVLVEHCNKLIGLSDSLQSWNGSPYATFLKMSTEYTLAELRRHWSLYRDMHDLPRKRTKAISNAFDKVKHSSPARKKGTMLSSARSSGPLMINAAMVASDQFKNYWETGLTFSNPKQIAAATLINPTFAYSLAGEGCAIHYGTDPLVPFHLAPLFGNAKGSVSVSDMVEAAKAEFGEWCAAYHSAVSAKASRVPVVRFFLGEATAVCRALWAFSTTGALNINMPVAQWKAQLIHLSKDEYISGTAPATFDVIETSNLNDHIGLLNVLIATAPLLATSVQSSVLYTESLLFHGQDATKEFAEHLHADITTIGLLIGLCPTDYISGFATRSNTHELAMNRLREGSTTQFHQVTTWKSPASADAIAVREYQPPVFDPHQLGTLLYDMYHELFEREDARHFMRLNEGNLIKAISSSNLIHYMRESFVLFLKFIRVRLCVSEDLWKKIMDRFFDLEDADRSLPMDSVNYQDLCAHLHRHKVYTVPVYHVPLRKIGLFTRWDTVPPLVRIVLTVPRDKLAVLESSVDQVGTPPLQCDVIGNWSHNIFTAVHVAYGRAILMDTAARPWVSFDEDPEGWHGTAPLVASFTMPTRLLTDIEPMEVLNVCFSVRSTTGTVPLINKLGLRLNIFRAGLLDSAHVLVVPEQPLPSRTQHHVPPGAPHLLAQIGESGAAVVTLDQECELVSSLTCRVLVQDSEAQTTFTAGTAPTIEQVSPCVMRLTVGTRVQDVAYPFPLIGSQVKLRLARKSLYIEVVVPVSGPFKPDGMKLNLFPVPRVGGVPSPWSVHHLDLARLPALDTTAPKLATWVNTHVGSMLSTRERSLRKKYISDALVAIKDSLHCIFVRATGAQGGRAERVFFLGDTLFFVHAVRFDRAAHTLVCDAHVLSVSSVLGPEADRAVAALVRAGVIRVNTVEGEMRVWKQLLPAFAERCRTSWVHSAECEYAAGIPCTLDEGSDPLCSCGRGRDTEAMYAEALWRPLAPHVSRVALGPLFAVSYLETVGRDPTKHRCVVCRGRGQPKLMTCMVCLGVRYCSRACQKKDWKAHKGRCKPHK